MIAGLATLIVIAAIYPTVAPDTAWPLAVFGIPPLVTATVSSWRQTVFVVLATVAVAVIEGAGDPITGGAFTARTLIVAADAALAIAASVWRGRIEAHLSDSEATAELSAALQRNLAPTPVAPPGFVVRTHYRAGEQRMHLGGDFFDAISLPDGALAVVMGDVSGHGPVEAAFGSAVRAGWKSAAIGAPDDPLEWVTLLKSAFFEDDRFRGFVTLCTGRIDASGHAIFVSAGHPWPICIGASIHEIEMKVGPPLAWQDVAGQWDRTEFDLHAGECILLYTDGLIENRLSAGGKRADYELVMDWVRERVTRDGGQQLSLVDLIEAFSRRGDYDDDVAAMLICIDTADDRDHSDGPGRKTQPRDDTPLRSRDASSEDRRRPRLSRPKKGTGSSPSYRHRDPLRV